MVQVAVAVHFTSPDKSAAIFQKGQVIVDFDIGRCCFREQCAAFAGVGIYVHQLQFILQAIHGSHAEMRRIYPFDARYVFRCPDLGSYLLAC